jgi:hypothetical protein
LIPCPRKADAPASAKMAKTMNAGRFMLRAD